MPWNTRKEALAALCRPIRPAQAARPAGSMAGLPSRKCAYDLSDEEACSRRRGTRLADPRQRNGVPAHWPCAPGSPTRPPRRLGRAGMQASLARPMTAARATKASDTHGLSRGHERRCAARQRILAGRIAQLDPTPHDVRALHAFWPARRAAIDQPGGIRFDPGTRLLTRETFWHRKIHSSVARNGSRPFRRRPCSNLPEGSPNRALRSQTSHL